MTKPVVLTSGDPSGVGLEIAFKAWENLRGDVPFCLIADPCHVEKAAKLGRHSFRVIDAFEDAEDDQSALPVLPHSFANDIDFGTPNLENAKHVIEVIERAVELVQRQKASAVCTNPIHKKVLQDGAGFSFPGHTEFLAHLAGVERSYMMLAAPEVKVVPATIHIALKDVPDALTHGLIIDTITATNESLKNDFGLEAPRIAVAGLNPHAGEGGAMGFEERDMIAPALEELQASGLDVVGPLSADTMFHPQARENYDAAVCMYHDQALIPIKTLNFSKGVNVTMGLPFVRTSPDHGTAFDIAGTGKADPDSLIEALRLAHKMAAFRQKSFR